MGKRGSSLIKFLKADALDSGNEVEMRVTAENGSRVLPGEGCNPGVIGRNGSGLLFQVLAYFGVMERGPCNDFDYAPMLR